MVAGAPKSLARRDREVQAGIMNRVRRRRIGPGAPCRQIVRQPYGPIELRRIEVVLEYQAKSIRALRHRSIMPCDVAPWFRYRWLPRSRCVAISHERQDSRG